MCMRWLILYSRLQKKISRAIQNIFLIISNQPTGEIKTFAFMKRFSTAPAACSGLNSGDVWYDESND